MQNLNSLRIAFDSSIGNIELSLPLTQLQERLVVAHLGSSTKNIQPILPAIVLT